ncbi:MAG: hypothetical protein Q9190_006290 [Brigantiaea leucoxantha]
MHVDPEVILDAATDGCILCRGPLHEIGENAANSEAAADIVDKEYWFIGRLRRAPNQRLYCSDSAREGAAIIASIATLHCAFIRTVKTYCSGAFKYRMVKIPSQIWWISGGLEGLLSGYYDLFQQRDIKRFSANALSGFLRERTTSPEQVCSANRMTAELYRLLLELPLELKDNITMYTWSCSFSPIVVLYESRALIEDLRLLTALRDRYTRPINLGLAEDLLLRDVSIGQKPFLDPAFKDIVEWNVPEAPEIDPKHCYHTSRLIGNAGPTRMRWIPLGRGLSGIVAAHGFQGMLTLHAWYDSSDIKSIYSDHPYITGDAQWMFFPIRTEECVSESQDRTSVTDIEFSPNKATERYESSWVEWPLQELSLQAHNHDPAKFVGVIRHLSDLRG